MLTQVDQPTRDRAAERLQEFIAEGNYGPGDRLPPERQLIELLGVGRSAMRRALERMERDGRIWRHVGKGTFVASERDGADDALSGIAHQMTPVRMMRARICIEPAIAREAAINASGESVAKINAVVQRARSASSWADYEHHDDLVHRAIAEATDNLLLVNLYGSLNRVQRDIAVGTVERDSPSPEPDHPSFAEHEAIARAIQARDPEGALQAMRAHLHSVSSRLFGET